MKKIHIEERERERLTAEKNGYTCIICIKDDEFHWRYAGETFCCWEKDGRFHIFASWTPDSFLGIVTPEYMEEHFEILV